jgi:hypothetical protein
LERSGRSPAWWKELKHANASESGTETVRMLPALEETQELAA